MAAFTNSHCAGRFKKYYWKDIQPTSATAYDWSDIDSQIAAATANKKQFTVLLNLNSGDPAGGIGALPAWLIAAGAKAYGITNDNHGTVLYQFLPWDTVWQGNALTFIGAFCDRYDGQLASVSMGGLGTTTEMHLPTTFPDGKTTEEAAVAYIFSSGAIIKQYGAHLHKTPFMMALAVPFAGKLGTDTLQTIVDSSLALYGARLGFENWGLNATSSSAFLPNKIIFDHRLTNPVGHQMTGSETTGGGGNLCGNGGPTPPCLRAAMEAGVKLGDQYQQVFGEDVANSAYSTDLDAVTAELLPSPTGLP